MKLYEQVWDLYERGYTIKEIAEEVYGYADKKHVNRVKQLLWYARKIFLKQPFFKPAITPNSPKHNLGNFVRLKKQIDSSYLRQYISHLHLCYFLLKKIGYEKNGLVWESIKRYHSCLFPLLYGEYWKKMRCWRNGSVKRPFSFTPYSLAYAYLLLDETFSQFMLNEARIRLDRAVKEIAPTRRWSWSKYQEAIRLMGGTIKVYVRLPLIQTR